MFTWDFRAFAVPGTLSRALRLCQGAGSLRAMSLALDFGSEDKACVCTYTYVYTELYMYAQRHRSCDMITPLRP